MRLCSNFRSPPSPLPSSAPTLPRPKHTLLAAIHRSSLQLLRQLHQPLLLLLLLVPVLLVLHKALEVRLGRLLEILDEAVGILSYLQDFCDVATAFRGLALVYNQEGVVRLALVDFEEAVLLIEVHGLKHTLHQDGVVTVLARARDVIVLVRGLTLLGSMAVTVLLSCVLPLAITMCVSSSFLGVLAIPGTAM